MTMKNIPNKANLTEQATAERKAYYKAWRAKNKDKVAQHNRNYWERKAQQASGGDRND